MVSIIETNSIFRIIYQVNSLCDKIGEENLRILVRILVRQMNRMEKSITSLKKSQTNQQPGTPTFGEEEAKKENSPSSVYRYASLWES